MTPTEGAQIINPRNDKIFTQIGSRAVRFQMFRECLEYYSGNMSDLSIINIHLDKTKPYSIGNLAVSNIQELVWTRLLERYHTFLHYKKSQGIVFADDTNEIQIRKLMRRMRRHHYVGSMYGRSSIQSNAANVIEDPIMRSSQDSYFIQVADMVSHTELS